MRSDSRSWPIGSPPAKSNRVVNRTPIVDSVDCMLTNKLSEMVNEFRGVSCGDSLSRVIEHPREGRFKVTIEFLGEA